jgi:hypothetical protein
MKHLHFIDQLMLDQVNVLMNNIPLGGDKGGAVSVY